jgi:glycerol uptake facilitator-like aquaporin
LFALTAFATAFGKHVWGNKAWIAIGFAIYLGNFVAGPFTGASLNPAVSIFLHDVSVFLFLFVAEKKLVRYLWLRFLLSLEIIWSSCSFRIR